MVVHIVCYKYQSIMGSVLVVCLWNHTKLQKKNNRNAVGKLFGTRARDCTIGDKWCRAVKVQLHHSIQNVRQLHATCYFTTATTTLGTHGTVRCPYLNL